MGEHGLPAGRYPWELVDRDTISLKLLPTHPYGYRLGQKHSVGQGSWGLQPSFAAPLPAAQGDTPDWSRHSKGSPHYQGAAPALLSPGD